MVVPTTIYHGSQRLWKSTNRGDSWTALSDDLTRNEERVALPIMGRTQSWDSPWDVNAMSNFNTITSIAVSPKNEKVIAIELKAKELVDYYRICFAQPAVEGILMWGFWERANWIPVSSFYKSDWTPTPAANAYQNLIFKEWWTSEKGKINEHQYVKNDPAQVIDLERKKAADALEKISLLEKILNLVGPQ